PARASRSSARPSSTSGRRPADPRILMSSVAQRLAQAVGHHQAGRLAEAEALYRAILAESPGQPHALHLLGVLAHQAGRPQEALDLIGRALAAHGPHPAFHSNLSAVYLAL